MKYAEYMQQIEYLPFPYEDLEGILNGRKSIKEWAFCLHDKDEHDDGTPKAVHVHVMMSLASDQTPQNIAKWFSDRPSQIEKGKTQTHTYDNMLRYLIHETPNSDGRYHYDDSEVVANFDFHERMESIRHGVEVTKQNKRKHPLSEVLQDICDNKIPRIKLRERVSDLDAIKYKRDINSAYEIRDSRLALEVERSMNVMYFSGPAGSGKTTWAKEVARKKGYSVFVSGSSNDPLQGYVGQECVILDDIRGSDWKINDLLKLLDNHTNSLVKSRYSNKLLNDCKLMILTSVESIDELYKGLKESQSEPIEQLKRRCADVLEFDERFITAYHYSEGERDYTYIDKVPNPTRFMQFAKENTSLINDTLVYMRDALAENANGEEYQETFENLQNMANDVLHFGEPIKIAPDSEDKPF